MKLIDYLNKYRITTESFARRCDISVSAMFHYLAGRRNPRQKYAERIEKEADGLVSVQELRGKDDRKT